MKDPLSVHMVIFIVQAQMPDSLAAVSIYSKFQAMLGNRQLETRMLDSCYFMSLSPTLHLAALCNCHICRRLALSSHSGVLNLVYNIHAVDDLAEDNMFVIQEWRGNLKHAFSKLTTACGPIEEDVQ